MVDRTDFFDVLRKGLLGPTLDKDEVSGCDAILDAMAGAPLSHVAYALATAYHETAHTMQPIREYGGPRYFFRMYDPKGERPALAKANGQRAGDGVRYYGRGYVQLTWRANYQRAGQKLNVDLEGNPDLALRPDIAAKILRKGMDEGWFTGKRFLSYLPATGPATALQFTAARRIINGRDKDVLIAGYAERFQRALQAGGMA